VDFVSPALFITGNSLLNLERALLAWTSAHSFLFILVRRFGIGVEFPVANEFRDNRGHFLDVGNYTCLLPSRCTKTYLAVHFSFLYYVPTYIRKIRVFLERSICLPQEIADLSFKRNLLPSGSGRFVGTTYSQRIQVGKVVGEESRIAIGQKL
jgi:hypothetical protein